MAKKDQFNRIIWPKVRPLRSNAAWLKNVKMIEMLCTAGIITRWIRGEKGIDEYVRMPYAYRVNGIIVEFLPHWDHYRVGAYAFRIRTNLKDMKADVLAVKTLRERLRK